MKCGNALARKYRDLLEEHAHESTKGIRVVVVHPRFTHAAPEYRNGTVRLPACLFDGIGWAWAGADRTWRHELQHAADDRDGILMEMTRDSAEARARAAEWLPRDCWGGGRR